jgi:RND family efflux transporter MFP subunit
MRSLAPLLVRLAVTCVAVGIAAVVGWQLWVYYMEEPWTRDGRVRADVVRVAPDVAGIVTEVAVRDNQTVAKGDVLFRIDHDRYRLALAQADAAVANRLAARDQADRDAERYRRLNVTAVSQAQREQAQSVAEQAAAAAQQAQADRDLVQLNLDRTEIRAPVNGIVTNLELQVGDYIAAGHPVVAVVDTDSFHVDGYFEETKPDRIRIGDPVTVYLIGTGAPLKGHVEGIASAIVDRERSSSTDLLANVNPTFAWVRLAQRIPVRIAIDQVPPGMQLISGRTATVVVEPRAPS